METVLFFIIVGIISTLFGKAKRTQGHSPKKPFTANGMEDIRTLFKELANEGAEQIRPKKTEQNKELAQEKMKNIEQEYLQVRQESEASRTGMAAARLQNEKLENQTIKPRQAESEPMISKEPDSNTVINGIIWGEILGEPRSKKPYFARKG
ncbi:hypothetical protein [Neobacillus sp. 19]|uniref:hypothetical protein n=1 Tax=Neobacillus sp. 19 TaxID=3394458 RepID=UPI003BF72718